MACSPAGPSWSQVLSGKRCGVCWTVWKDLASRVPFTMCWVGSPVPLPPPNWPPKVSMGCVALHTMAVDCCICFYHRGLPPSPAPHAGGPRKPSSGPLESLRNDGLLACCGPSLPGKRTRQVIARASVLAPPHLPHLPREPLGKPLCRVSSRAFSLPCSSKARDLWPPYSYFSYCKWTSHQDG